MAIGIAELGAEASEEAVQWHSEFADRAADDLQRAGRVAEARKAYDVAIALQQAVLDERPDSVDARRDLARTHNNRGILFWESVSRPSDPGFAAFVTPVPISTALTAWIETNACAMRPSSFSVHEYAEPNPMTTPFATTSKTPPSVSPSFFARSISAIISA